MNNVWLALSSVSDSFAWALAWQSTLWLALGLFAGRLLRRHPARAHLALVLATLAALISPILTRAARHLEWGVLPPSDVAAARVGTPMQLLATSAAGDGFVGEQRRQSATTAVTAPATNEPVSSRGTQTSAAAIPARIESWLAARRESLTISLVTVWIACSLALSLRLAASLQAGRHVVRQASAETDAGRLAALGEAARTLAIGSAPVLRVSTAVRCPMIWCWGRQPVLIAPRSTAGQDKLSWSAIFRHELAHWLRRDHWAALGADLVVIAVWWQPLAWRVRRRMALLREQACDDWVLAGGGKASDYADSLLSFAEELRPAVGLSMLGGNCSLKDRLEHLFADVRVTPRVGTAGVAAAVFVVMTAVVGVSLAQQRPQADQAAARSTTTVGGQRPQVHFDGQAGSRRFSGRVVQPDGRAASGARVYFTRSSAPARGELKATTGGNGEFEFSVPSDALFGALWLRIVAVKPGFGPAWIEAEELKHTSGLTLPLATDDLPIEGRLMNLEGRPVAGATVRVESIRTFAGDDPKPYVKLLKNDRMRAANFGGLSWLMEIPERPSARTDDRGVFRLSGVGRHRRAELTIAGDAIADTRLDVLTDPYESMLNVPDATFAEPPVYGARFAHHVRPARTIAGIVTDAQTGRPLEGARVQQFPGFSQAVTDASGRFNLRGCEKTNEYRLVAGLSGARSPYFSGSLTVRDTPGLGPIEVELHVYSAIPLTGRVVDRVTGKPVPAEVSYWPVYRNPHVVKGICGTAIRASGPYSTAFSKPDGSFSVGVLPGAGALVVRMPGKSDYEPASVDAAAFFEKQGVPYTPPDYMRQMNYDYLAVPAFEDAAAAMPQSQFQGIALLNVPEAATQITQNIDVHSKTNRVGR
jgi:beta-lactamase regulating signal transducer with metallopeptidase domain